MPSLLGSDNHSLLQKRAYVQEESPTETESDFGGQGATGCKGSRHHPRMLYCLLDTLLYVRKTLLAQIRSDSRMYVWVQFCSSCVINPHIEMFITWLGYSNSAMNPIIYTV